MKFRTPATLLSVATFTALAAPHIGAQSAQQSAAAAPMAGAPAAATPAARPPLLDISAEKPFPFAATLNDDAAKQLKGLASYAEFTSSPQEERYFYTFGQWPAATDALGASPQTFNFRVGDNLPTEKVTFASVGGGPGGNRSLTRFAQDGGGYQLRGFGNLDWSGTIQHTFTFDKPVMAFGVVLRSSGDVDLRKFYWQAAVERNGYPVSYTLADGSVVNLGARNLSGAVLKADQDNYVGVRDRSGLGITSVTYTIKGLAGNKAQSIALRGLAFSRVTRPAQAALINLRSSNDFYSPEEITPAPEGAAKGLASLEDFRFIVGTHRYVYRFDTMPQNFGAAPEFPFDLRGKGQVGQKLRISASNGGKAVKVVPVELKNSDGLHYRALGGLGTLSQANGSEQTFHFSQPVWAVGVTYRAPQRAELAGAGGAKPAISYILGDKTTGHLGAANAPAGKLKANEKTFVGMVDKSGKGISSFTVNLRASGDKSGAAAAPLAIEEVAFALAGPPPGDWKLTLADEFDGDRLNPKIWAPGYTFPDIINNELQGYVPENVTVANGVCTIKVEQRTVSNTDRKGRTGGKQQFASGAFTSYDKFIQTYGYFEARLKMPKARGAGVWPAFWMLPDRGREYPDTVRGRYMTKDYGRGMEIDIFEFMPRWKREDGKFPVHMGCIWSYAPISEKDPAPHGYGAYALDNDGWGPNELHFPALDEEFHTYGLYWSPERLIFYIDSKPVFRARNPDRMPDVPHYFLFNIALSGNGWGKSPDKKHPTMQEIIEDLPNAMEIDYFRAYSGVLEEPIPPAPSDIPGPVNKYKPPKEGDVPAPAPAAPASPNPAQPANVPPPPANVGINTPSN